MGRAIKSAAAIAKLKDYKVVLYPEPVDKLNAIMRRIKANSSAQSIVAGAVKEQIGDDFKWLERLQDYRKINGKMLMEMPFAMEVE